MKNIAYFFITSAIIILALIYGKTLLIPFVFALLLWFIIREIRRVFNKIKWVDQYFPLWLRSFIPAVAFITVLAFISKLLMLNINTLARSYPLYEGNVEIMIEQLNALFQINIIDYFKTHVGAFNFGNILQQIFQSLSDLLSNAFIIVIYALFIFLEEAHFNAKLKAAFNNNNQFVQFNEVLKQIEISVSKYIGLKTIISGITGFASYVVLLFIGIDAPLFWAFLIFLLNFIPTIGSLIGTIFPVIFCLLQFGNFSNGLLVLGIVGSIQIVVGNLLEPKLMGNTLNISSFVAIFALSFWGVLWGVMGMFLSIPITVIMIIVLAHFKSTKPIAIMLSEKGKV